MKKRKARFQVIYKDVVTGITYFVKRKVDGLYLGGAHNPCL